MLRGRRRSVCEFFVFQAKHNARKITDAHGDEQIPAAMVVVADEAGPMLSCIVVDFAIGAPQCDLEKKLDN